MRRAAGRLGPAIPVARWFSGFVSGHSGGGRTGLTPVSLFDPATAEAAARITAASGFSKTDPPISGIGSSASLYCTTGPRGGVTVLTNPTGMPPRELGSANC